MNKKDTYPTTAPEKKEITIENYSNLKNTFENKVSKYKKFEEENIEVTGDEIEQQNENL